MKKIVFGCTLIIAGALILLGALIGGGAWASGNSFMDISDSKTAYLFLFVGAIVFITGFVIAVKEVNRVEQV